MRDLSRAGRRSRSRRALVAGVLLATSLVASGVAWAIDPTAQDDKKAAEQAAGVVQKTVVAEAVKSWSVWAIFETHWRAVRDNYAADDVYNNFYLYANYDLPKIRNHWNTGRITLRTDFTIRYVADPGESGFLAGDLRLYYSLPFVFKIKGQEFTGRGFFYWTFPTSKVAHQEGNIARPTILGMLSKELPRGFTLIFRPFIRLNWMRYAEKEGGGPNQKWNLGYDFWVLYTIPWFEKKFGLGVIFGQDWANEYTTGTTADAVGGQPWVGQYFWEAFLSYTILQKHPNPRLKPLTLDTYVSVTSGRKTIDDGVWRFRLFERRETELYLAVRAFY